MLSCEEKSTQYLNLFFIFFLLTAPGAIVLQGWSFLSSLFQKCLQCFVYRTMNQIYSINLIQQTIKMK